MSVDDSLRVTFGEGINLQHAEDAIRTLGHDETPPKSIVLDFSYCHHVDAFAGVLLGNSLRRFAHPNSVEVILPHSPGEDFAKQWYRSFTKSGLGFALARYASLVRSSETDLTTTFRDYYRRVLGTPAQNLVVIPDLDQETAFNIDDLEVFRSQLERLLPKLNTDVSVLKRDDRVQLASLCLEAVQNVRDHAGKAPMPMGTEFSSALIMQYYRQLSRAKDQIGQFDEYLSRVALSAEHATRGFLDITVADDGVGIAARQSQNSGIYWQEMAEERDALVSALSEGGTIKLRSSDSAIRGDPGYGFTHIAQSITGLKAYATLRTGRFLAVFDGTLLGESGFLLRPSLLGYVPGTIVSIIVPIPASQLSLPIA